MLKGTFVGQGGPLVAQVTDRLSQLIDVGTYAPGDRVPSIRQLAAEWSISPTTVVAAYQRLSDAGVLYPLPRQGFVVQGRPAEQRLMKGAFEVRDPCLASFSTDIQSMFEDSVRLRFGGFASALPDESCLPTTELQAWLRRCLREEPDCGMHYDIGCGDLSLRRQIARRWSRRGLAIAPDDVVVTTGCTEALMLSLSSVCARGDVVAVESPTYFNHIQVLEHLGLRIIELPIDPVHGLEPEILEAACRRHKISAYLSVPVLHNPTGVTLTAERQAALLNICNTHDIVLIEDLVYLDLHPSPQRSSIFKDADRDGRVISCGSISKTLAPGWRVGWALPGRCRDTLRNAKVISSLGSPVLQQRALAGFLSDRGDRSVLVRTVHKYKQHMDHARGLILGHFPTGTRCSDPQGGMVLWVELPEGIDVDVLYQRAIGRGIAFAPGRLFGLQQNYKQYLRLSIAKIDAAYAHAIQDLGRMASRLLHY